MKRRPRIHYTEEQKTLMWDRWQQGESLHAIAGLFDRHHSSIAGVLRRTGGMRPAQRKRSSRALTMAEREEISRGLARLQSMRSIAAQLGRSTSTVSREVARNGGYACYRASVADQAAWRRALRPKACKLAVKLPRFPGHVVKLFSAQTSSEFDAQLQNAFSSGCSTPQYIRIRPS